MRNIGIDIMKTEMKWNFLEPCNFDWKLIVRNLSVKKPADCKKSFRQKTCMWFDYRKEWYISDESYSISQSLWSTRNNVLPFDLLPFPLINKKQYQLRKRIPQAWEFLIIQRCKTNQSFHVFEGLSD